MDAERHNKGDGEMKTSYSKMKKENQAILDKYNFIVMAYDVYDGYDCNSETESVIGDDHYLVEDNDPSTTGIDVFSDIPQEEVP